MCEYCEKGKPLFHFGEFKLQILKSWTNPHGETFDGWSLWLFSPGEAVHEPIVSCPMCGRELKGEAE